MWYCINITWDRIGGNHTQFFTQHSCSFHFVVYFVCLCLPNTAWVCLQYLDRRLQIKQDKNLRGRYLWCQKGLSILVQKSDSKMLWHWNSPFNFTTFAFATGPRARNKGNVRYRLRVRHFLLDITSGCCWLNHRAAAEMLQHLVLIAGCLPYLVLWV